MRPRTTGSVRFDPYWKVQTWEATDKAGKPLRAWVDVQVRHLTIEAAVDAYVPGKRCRLMAVTMAGRAPVPGSEADLT